MGKIIELDDVCKVYGKTIKTHAICAVSIGFESGEFSSIIGASGSGKSTLLNIMGTLDKPTSGSVIIDGQRVDSMGKDELAALRNRMIGFVFQFHHLLPEFTARENILMPYFIRSAKVTPEISKWADTLINLMGLEKVSGNRANDMSGGQQQRTAIARALINRPKIVLADEPTGNLDNQSAESIYSLLREINDEYGTTFIVITHDQRIAEKTDRIVEISDGSVKKDWSKMVK